MLEGKPKEGTEAKGEKGIKTKKGDKGDASDKKDEKKVKSGKEAQDTKPKKATIEGEKQDGGAMTPTPIDTLPPLDAQGNPICVQPDPPPTFAELWFDDPIEGEAAQKLALELRQRIELRALPIRNFLEQAIVPLLLQGLQHMVLERPTNPAEYLAAFLLRNNPLKDAQYVEPPPIPPATVPPPKVEASKCSCCQVHCPTPLDQDVAPDFFRKCGNPGMPTQASSTLPSPTSNV